jgi:hypothetical protein
MREQLNIQISDDHKARLYQLAEQLGYTRRVGTTTVGNISALFKAIATGTLTVSRKERIVNYTLIAEQIYSEHYGHLDAKGFRAEKTQEIIDWLSDGNPGDYTVSELIYMWAEYDADEIERQNA